MHGRDVPVKARMIEVEGLSAHADAEDIDRWVRSGPALPTTAFLVHGEPSALSALSDRLAGLGLRTHVPALYEEFEREGNHLWRSLQ
jgi:metallo-beta-lactamase family protein